MRAMASIGVNTLPGQPIKEKPEIPTRVFSDGELFFCRPRIFLPCFLERHMSPAAGRSPRVW